MSRWTRLRVSGGVGRQPTMKHAPKWVHVSCQSAVEGQGGSRPQRTCPHGHVGLQGKGRRGQGCRQTRKTRDVSRVFCVLGVVRGQGGSRAQRTCLHGHVLGVGLQRSALARKSGPCGHDFRVRDKGWGRRAAEHEKHARVACFSCPGGGESAGEGCWG